MKKHTRRAALLALCLLLAWDALALAASAKTEERKTVRVGWFESTFCNRDTFGRRRGVAYEYQQKLALYTGWEYEYVEDSWPNLLEMLKRGELDLLSDVSYTEERLDWMLFPDLPMGEEAYYIYIDADNRSLSAEDPASFNGKRIGANKGSVQARYLYEWAQRNGVTPEIVELTEEETVSMDMLARGELDAYASMNTFGATEHIVPVCKIGGSDFYFAVNKSRPDLLAELNAALTAIHEEDPYFNQKMFDQYVYLIKTNAYLTGAQEDWLDAHGTIRVGYRDDYLPFCARDEATGELTGALRDYLAHAANSLVNAELRFEATPYPSTEAALEAMRAGEVDCVFPVNLSTYDAEQLGLVMTDAAMKTEMYAIMRTTDSRGISRARSFTVALGEGRLNAETFLKDGFPAWRAARYGTTKDCLGAVSSGKADCMLICSYRVGDLERSLARYGLYAVPTGETMSLGFAVSREARELFFILNKTIVLTNGENMDAALAAHSRTAQKVTFSQFLYDNWIFVFAFISALFVVVVLLLFQKLEAQQQSNERQKLINDERVRHQQKQEELLRRQLRQQEQLDSAMELVYTDPLTGARSKHAYVEAERRMDQRIDDGAVETFGVVVFDLNDLKRVNDTLGHELGDQYIRDACKLIRATFRRSPIYRIGGDEFCAIVEGEDARDREALLRAFDEQMTRNAVQGGVVVASGCAAFEPERDKSVRSVFERADESMYRRKKLLKELRRDAGKGARE